MNLSGYRFTPRGALILLGGIYLLASLVHGPKDPEEMEGVLHWQVGPVEVAPPMVLSGDSPHYLAAISSLLRDRDLDLKNNYQRSLLGERDLGVRFRGRTVDHHTDIDNQGRELGTHSPFFALLLAALSRPFHDSSWVEPVVIWWTAAAGLTAVWLLGIYLRTTNEGSQHPDQTARSMLVLGLATPLLCYSRDLWTEPWIAAVWTALLVVQHPVGLALLGFCGTLIKYPFVVVPATMGIVALWKQDRTRALSLIGGAGAGIVTVIVTVQFLFQGVNHFSLFHSGIHAGFGWPFEGIGGLLFSSHSGLFVFFPFLVWGARELWRCKALFFPAAAFFLVHAGYQDWAGGTGFSARYLVPVLPLLVIGLNWSQPNGRIFKAALIYSLGWGLFGGFLPALVYDRSPWGVIYHFIQETLAS